MRATIRSPRRTSPSGAALLPEAKLATIEGGVPLPDQCPDAFAAALLAFLDALP